MKNIVLILALCVTLVGCATPVVMLKNSSTGQVVRCGGERSGAMMGGMIGYSLQEGDAEMCVHNFEAQGFKRVQ